MKYSKQTLTELKGYIRKQIMDDSKMIEYLLLNATNFYDSLKDRLIENAKEIQMYTAILELLENAETDAE